MHEYYHWIALRLVCGIGNINYNNLIKYFGSPEKIFHAGPDELAKVEGITASVVEAITTFKPTDNIDRELERIRSQRIRLVTLNCPNYPENLKNIYDPPPFLYVKGELKEADKHAVAVVGSRNASEYGIRLAGELSRDLTKRHLTIVSGMARGIDSVAHHAALACGGRTIAVLGCGVDVVYPFENKKLYSAVAENGAVVSEYPLGTKPLSYHFPVRNRIISGLSLGVLVVEASPKSGSLITARLAAEQGRDVFAVPGNVFSFKTKGTHTLLKCGAKLVEDARDIIDELQAHLPRNTEDRQEAVKPRLEPDAQNIYDRLHQEPVHIDELLLSAGLPAGRLSAVLLDLELSGMIRQLPGKRFVKNP